MLNRRQRTGYLVLAVVVGHVILISAQVNARPGTSVLESVTFSLFAEAQRLTTSVGEGLVGVWGEYVSLRGLRAENEVLSQDLAALQLQMQEQRAMSQHTERLERLLDFRQRLPLRTVSARVIAADATPYFLTLTVDRGAQDGIRSDMAVIEPAGIVGRIIGEPGPRAARVQLLIDRNAAAGAIIERTRASGVAMGDGDETSLRMEYVSNLETVLVGDRIVTSGIDGIYPKGFIIGTVTYVAPGAGLHQAIRIEPAVEFSRLEEVLVVMNVVPLASRETESE